MLAPKMSTVSQTKNVAHQLLYNLWHVPYCQYSYFNNNLYKYECSDAIICVVEEEKCGFQGSSTLIIMEDGRSLGVPHYSCSNLAMTYTGLACLIILGDDLSRVNRKACIRGVRALQQNDGRSDKRFVISIYFINYCTYTEAY